MNTRTKQGLQAVRRSDLQRELERVLTARLKQLLLVRSAGHCMRVADLDRDLMVRLCEQLRAEVPTAQVFVLGDVDDSDPHSKLYVTSTKLIELRNPLPDNSLRPPLLVFVPNDLRTSSEDSFGIATFEMVSVGEVYGALQDRLLSELPPSLRTPVLDIFQQVAEHDWKWAGPLERVRFLLTIKLNDNDSDVVGGALFELGLVPDFQLLKNPAVAGMRVRRNLECVRRLTYSGRSERARVLELDLTDRAFKAALGNFLVQVGLETPHQWTPRLVLDRENWQFSFDKWPFEDGGEIPQEICIQVDETDLPVIPEDEEDPILQQLVGHQVLPLGPQGLRKLGVTFRVDPLPSRVQGLAQFKLHVYAQDGGSIGLVRSKSAWSTNRNMARVTFTNLNKVDWEEGWHYVRVLAYTEEGDLIPLVDEQGQPIPWGGDGGSEAGQHPNESDLFYVLPGGDVDVEPTQRAIPKRPSVWHAHLDLQFSALIDGRDPHTVQPQRVAWTERGTGTLEQLEVKFGAHGSVNIPVSRVFKRIEQRILQAPRSASAWQVQVRLGEAQAPVEASMAWPEVDEIEPFLDAREHYFDAILRGSQHLISQAADWESLHPLALEYAAAYQQLVQSLLHKTETLTESERQKAFTQLRHVLALDAVTLIITAPHGERRMGALLGPTHPLRALWLTTWAALGRTWLENASKGPKEFVSQARDALLERLSPFHFPALLVTPHNRILAAVDDVHPFWTLYAPTEETDPRGLVGEVTAAFGLPEPDIGAAAVSGRYLATRAQRYLIQHPYIRMLTINAFNAGRAKVLADMLLELQRIPAFEDLSYNITLFVSDPDAPGVGEALEDLLSPSGSIKAREADAFSTPSGSHLHPKLSLAIRPTEDFQQDAFAHRAHLTFLFDVFPTEEVGAAVPEGEEGIAPLHGLYQDFNVVYFENEHTVAWRRSPRHGEAIPLEDHETAAQLLSTLPEMLSRATATVSTGEGGINLRPVITLALDTKDRALIHQVHEISDWVFTIDRNMGIEFFDHGGRRDRPDYLIDHSPDLAAQSGHRVVITSRSVEEIEALLQRTLAERNLTADGGRAAAILDQLRSLSGRLALKLISTPAQRTEALGLALARLYLDYQGAFADQVVIPLDAHLELYRDLEKSADVLGDAVSFKRTDLALFDLNAQTRTISCNLVEVKCYTQVGSFSAYNQLKENIAEQLRQSERVLQHHFDPQKATIDRSDRRLKTRELVTLLEFYLNRSVRFGLIKPDVEEEASYLLRTLEQGYRLVFTRSAVIFDFDKPGTEAAEHEAGIEFHRVGIDLIRELIDASSDEESREAKEAEIMLREADAATGPEYRLHLISDRTSTIPKLGQAAFLVPERERSVTREDLADEALHREEGHRDGATIYPLPIPERSLAAEPDNESEGGHPEHATEQLSTSDSNVEDATDYPTGKEDTPPVQTVSDVDEETRRVTRQEVTHDVLLGVSSVSPQYGILGEVAGRKVALDLNHTHTISLFGVQGGGKSYTLGTIVEMATTPIPQINVLPKPLATVIFHYSPTQDYQPEFTSMVAQNSEENELDVLRERYGAEPCALGDVVLLTPADKLEERRAEFPGIEVFPLTFSASELQASHWRFLMGAVGNQATYIRQLNMIMRTMRDDLSLEGLRAGVDQAHLPDHLKDLARMRLDLAAHYIDDGVRLTDLIHPGRLIIVDLRDEFVEKDEALGLFVVLLQIFAEARYQGESFNKLIVFDEAHKYIDSPDLVAGLVEVVREMRHKGTSIMVASQDPPSVPISLIELSSQIILHKFNSPAWLKHIQKSNAALGDLNPERMAHLGPGEAYVWSSKASDVAFSKGTVKIFCRPRVTQHGGTTKTAVT